VNGLSVLLVGIALGMRHALDADHVVVVSGLVQREPGVWRAARVAALWGAGHAATFLGLGLLIVLAELRLPAFFETAADILVGLVLIGFGLWHLAATRSSNDELQPAPSTNASVRPVFVGLVHGLAGSAGVALVAATTIASRTVAVAYLVLVALGTVLGMVALTVAISRPMGWMLRGEGPLKQMVGILAALLSLALGVALLARVAGHDL
jgi:nickel/cobalt exporter